MRYLFADCVILVQKENGNKSLLCYLQNDTTHNTIHITEASTANSCAVWVESECGLANASYFTLNRTFVQLFIQTCFVLNFLSCVSYFAESNLQKRRL